MSRAAAEGLVPDPELGRWPLRVRIGRNGDGGREGRAFQTDIGATAGVGRNATAPQGSSSSGMEGSRRARDRDGAAEDSCETRSFHSALGGI